MQNYEIRVLRRDNRPLVVASRFLGDFHAIQRAQAMAEEDEGIEVWRGMTCLYRREVMPKIRRLYEPSPAPRRRKHGFKGGGVMTVSPKP